MNTSSHRNGLVHDERLTLSQATPLVRPEEPEPLLIAQIGGRSFAVPVTSVERILRMAEITPLPGASNGVVGVLNYRGTVLAVVDPRPALGVPRAPYMPDQYLVLVSADHRFFLWVDHVESLAWLEAGDSTAARLGSLTPGSTPVANIDGRVLPVLTPSQWDPTTGLQHPNLLVDRAAARV